jgi:hypothetical protein
VRGLVLVGLLALGGGVMGCALFGVTTGEDGKPVSDGKGGIVGTVVGTWFPWAGTLIAGAAGVYADAKRRGWKSAAVSTVASVEQWKTAHPEQWDALKKVLSDSHERAKVKSYIDALTP